MNDALAVHLVKFRWPYALLSLILTFLLAYGGQDLVFDNDYRVFFKKDNAELVNYELIQERYTSSDNIFVAFTPSNGTVYEKDYLMALEQFTQLAWQTPFSARVDSISNFQHTEVEEDDLNVDDLIIESEFFSDSDIKRVERIAKSEPLLANRLISEEGHVTAINIRFNFPEDNAEKATFTHQQALVEVDRLEQQLKGSTLEESRKNQLLERIQSYRRKGQSYLTPTEDLNPIIASIRRLKEHRGWAHRKLLKDLLNDVANTLNEMDPGQVHSRELRNGLFKIREQLGLIGNQDVYEKEVGLYVRDLIQREMLDKFPETRVSYAGIAIINQTFNQVAEDDLATLIPAMFLLVLVVLMIAMRSIAATICTLLIIITGSLSATGFQGWIGYTLNNVNVSASIIILTLAVADSVHLLTNYLVRASTGQSKRGAMIDSLRINIQPIFITSLTTSVGFLSLNYSESPPFGELGNITAFGVMITFLYTICLLPAVGMIAPVKQRDKQSPMGQFIDKHAEFVINNRNTVFWSSLSFSLLLSACLFLNDINDRTMDYFSDDVALRSDALYLEKNMTTMTMIEYSIDSGDTRDGAIKADFLKTVDEFVEWYRQQPETYYVNSYTEIIKRLNRDLNQGDPEKFKIPDSDLLTAQYSLLYEMSLPLGLDINSQVDAPKSSLRVTAVIDNLKAKDIIAFEDRVSQWFQKNAPELEPVGTGPAVMFAYIGQKNTVSTLIGNVIATALIILVIIISLRSFKFGLLSLAPNTLPIMMTFGIWGLTVAEVNMGVAIVGSICIGIIVDDTIHFMSKYIYARRQQFLSAEDSIRYAFANVGRALITTTVVLAIGFSVLALSDFQVNASMGMMVAMTITIALIFDFLFLPAMLLKASRKHNDRQPEGRAERSTI